MHLLLVSATTLELRPFLSSVGVITDPQIGDVLRINDNFSVLVTGVGQVACAYHLGVALANQSYDFVLNVGICGSFDPKFVIRTPLVIISEVFADLGAEREGRNIDLFEMGLADPHCKPFDGGRLLATIPDWEPLRGLARVNSITVNRLLGRLDSIKDVKARYNPDVVNMEGAAAYYACISRGVPVLSLRTVSDLVGARSKDSWDIPGAIEVLGDHLVKIFLSAGSLSSTRTSAA